MTEDKFFKDKFNASLWEDEIYEQLAKTMARCIDIDFSKTPVIDIFTGYSRYKQSEEECKRLKEQTRNIKTRCDDYEKRIRKARRYILNSGDMSIVNDYSFPTIPIIGEQARTDLLKILKGE